MSRSYFRPKLIPGIDQPQTIVKEMKSGTAAVCSAAVALAFIALLASNSSPVPGTHEE
jgi:hypothetical protein